MTILATSTGGAPTRSQRPRVSRILLATDGSTHAVRAGDAARDLAHRLGATVDVVAVWDVVPVTYAIPAIASAVVWAEAEAESRQLAQHTSDEMQSAGVGVQAHIVEGKASRRILEIADDVDADLIVMGSRGRGLVRRLVLGSTSEEVLQTSGRPVLVARGGADAWPPRRILVGHDGSHTAHEAARLAAVLADVLHVPLELAGVVPCDDGRTRPSAQAALDMRRLLESAATRLADLTGVTATVDVLCGTDPAKELGELAQDEPSTLIALGAHGAGSRSRHRMGHTAGRLMHASAGSVLLVPESVRRPY